MLPRLRHGPQRVAGRRGAWGAAEQGERYAWAAGETGRLLDVSGAWRSGGASCRLRMAALGPSGRLSGEEWEGTVYGFVQSGVATLHGPDAAAEERIPAGRWFSVALACGRALCVAPTAGARVWAAAISGWAALNTFGGPLEPVGRLRYIDGCSATVLSPPPRLGDPCLNYRIGADSAHAPHPAPGVCSGGCR
eukprot:TRINITY_DN44957_c0_g1_i2.p1 TRINITY_DN44957_c0_g1~~TRINITY_DN44957_c0_g1_i2.p1  ORF type:complete len:193 (+),score=23.69 TRINITY_DN44957_c0_g1_i2:71-649(+)